MKTKAVYRSRLHVPCEEVYNETSLAVASKGLSIYVRFCVPMSNLADRFGIISPPLRRGVTLLVRSDGAQCWHYGGCRSLHNHSDAYDLEDGLSGALLLPQEQGIARGR